MSVDLDRGSGTGSHPSVETLHKAAWNLAQLARRAEGKDELYAVVERIMRTLMASFEEGYGIGRWDSELFYLNDLEGDTVD